MNCSGLLVMFLGFSGTLFKCTFAQGPVRLVKLRDITNEWTEEGQVSQSCNAQLSQALLRIEEFEQELEDTRQALSEIKDVVEALSFVPDKMAGLTYKGNPCQGRLTNTPEDEDNKSEWVLWNSHSCVKIIPGLFEYGNASELCRKEIRRGEDIQHPIVVTVDSIDMATSLINLLQVNSLVTSVWVDTTMEISNGSAGLECSELRFPQMNSVEGVEATLVSVDCTRLNSVVCQKTVPVPYVTLVQLQLEEIEKHTTLETRMKKVEAGMTEFKKFQKAHFEMNGKKGMVNFEPEKALGVWHHIEIFAAGKLQHWTCFEEHFVQTISGVKRTRWYVEVESRNKRSDTFYYKVELDSPAKWVADSGYYWTWLTTDYESWGILGWSNDKGNLTQLRIVSREWTINPRALESLRLLAFGYGVPDHVRRVYDNTDC